MISEGKLERQYLNKGDKQYFIFTLPEANTDELESVSFYFTAISGVSAFTVSRITKYPEFKDQEEAAVVLEEKVTFNKSNDHSYKGVNYNLQGPYYIAVECSLSACYYTLNS